MKKTQIVFTCLALLFALMPFARAQTTDDATSLEAEAAGLSLLPSVPTTGTFWLVTSPTNGANGIMAPFPCPPPGISGDSFYIMANGIYLVDADDDAGASFSEIEAEANAVSNLIAHVETTTATQTSRTMGIHALDDSGPPSFSDTNDAGGDYYTNLLSLPPINTNILWIQITNVANGLAYLNLNMATDTVYAIWGTSNLLTPFTNWQVVAEVWPTNETTNVLPFTMETDNSTTLFWQAEDWTGVEINGLPAWWSWLYFGNTDESATNLDGAGNTLLYDYQYDVNIDDISFTVRLGNNLHFNVTNASGTYVLLGGVPSYEAVLVDDTNTADAVWQPYDGVVHMDLGPTDGVYSLQIGLKGFPQGSAPTWLPATVYLDRTPPKIGISSPTNSTVAVPILQLQGWSDESLQSVTFDVSNAVGVVTNQFGQLMDGQFFDTNTFEYTTDYFQCLDVPLTNGLNIVTLHATDLAGNVTVTNMSYTLDYSTATNPVIQLTWPQNGMQICGNNFTLYGVVNDATANIIATITDTNGDANIVEGLVERNGTFWVENLPLNMGTNWLTLVVTNAAGLASTTNIMVTQNSTAITLNPVSGDLWLPPVSVGGTISSSTETIWVNGVQGTNNGDGTWNASNVPIGPGGTAVLDVTAYPPGENPGSASFAPEDSNPSDSNSANSEFDLDKATEIIIDSAHGKSLWNNRPESDFGYNVWQYNYSEQGGGTYQAADEYGSPSDFVRQTYESEYAPNYSGINGQGTFQDDSPATNEFYSFTYTNSSPLTVQMMQGQFIYSPNTLDESVQTYQTRLVLRVGGKSQAGAGNELITADIGLSDEMNQWIPDADITLMGQSEMGGYAYVSPPVDGMDATPQAGAPAFSFLIYGIGPAILNINAQSSTTNASLSEVVPKFCVGQQVIFNLSGLPGTVVNMVANWSLPNNFVNEPTNYSATCTNYVENDALLKNTNETACWFYDGTGGAVSVGLNLLFPNGKYVSMAAKGNISVYRPQITSLVPSTNVEVIFNTNNLSNIYLGVGQPGGTGQNSMQWSLYANISTNFHGYGTYVQLINRNFSWNQLLGIPYSDSTSGSYWLDTQNPYGASGPFYTGLTQTNVNWLFSDGPEIEGAFHSYANCADSFKTYVCFQPNGSGSIPVTIGRVDWGWLGDAALSGGGWLLTTNSIIGPTLNADDSFPLWQNIHTQ